MEQETRISNVQEFDIMRGQSRHAWEEDDGQRDENRGQRDDKCLRRALKPILVCMAMCGCFNFSELFGRVDNKTRSARFYVSFVYQIFCFVISLLGLTKLAVTVYALPEARLILLLQCMWTVSLILCFGVCFRHFSSKWGHYEKAEKQWVDRVVPCFQELGIVVPDVSINKQARMWSVISIMISTMYTATYGLQMLVMPVELVVYPLKDTPWSRMMSIILVLYENSIWIVPIAHMTVLTRLVTTCFELFNKHLKMEIEKNKNRIPKSFPKLFILHQDISKLLTELDTDMRWFFTVSFSFSIFLLIFVMYWITKTSKPLNTIYIYFTINMPCLIF